MRRSRFPRCSLITCRARAGLERLYGIDLDIAGGRRDVVAERHSSSTNDVAFTNGGGKTWAGTAVLSHIGYRDSGNNYYAGQETHGYTPRESNAIYTSASPYGTPSGYSDVWAVTITNNASVGTANLTQFEVVMPTAYSPGGTMTNISLDGGSPTNWTVVIPCPVAGAPASSFCLKTAGGNGGVAPGAAKRFMSTSRRRRPEHFRSPIGRSKP